MSNAEPANKDIQTSFGDYSSLLGNKLFLMLIAAISFPILTRLLGVARYGQYSLIMLVADIFVILAIGWTDSSVSRYGKEEFVKTGKINVVFWTRAVVVIAGVLTAFVFIGLLREQVKQYIGIEDNLILIGLAVLIVMNAAYGYLKLLFMSTSQLKKSALIESLNKLACLLFLILAMVLFRESSKLLVIILLVNILALMVAICITASGIDKTIFFPVNIDMKLMREMARYSYPFIFISSISLVFNYIDIIVIKKYMAIESVGFYSIAYKIMSLARNFIAISGYVILPILVGYYAIGKIENIKRYFKDIIPAGLCLWAAFIALSMMMIKPVFVVAFGQRFAPSIAPAQILLCGLTIYGVSFFCRGILSTFKETKVIMLISISGGILNLVGDFILVPKIGLMGAAISTAVSFSYLGVAFYIAAGKKLGEYSYKVFLPALPVILSPLFIFYEIYWLVWLVFNLVAFYFIIKFLRIFNPKNRDLLEQIEMPALLKANLLKIHLFFERA